MHEFLIVIPARLGSTRLPGKVLADLGGIPVVEWCRRAALKADLGPVVVATDSPKVEEALKPFGAEVVMTPESCASGSDRVWAAAGRKGLHHFPFILNLQGDAPFLKPDTVRKTALALQNNPTADIATAVVPLKASKEISYPQLVKAVMAKDGRCLYFSRAAVPWSSSGPHTGPAADGPEYFGHLGIYAYRRGSLKKFVELDPSPLELRERLEQLRALEAGMTIVAASVEDSLIAIDTAEDLERARASISEKTGVQAHG